MNPIVKCSFFILVGFFYSIIAQAQIKVFQFEQLDSLQNLKNKTVLVFIYTDWCQYCQSMKNTSFKDKEIIKLLNDKYYFIYLNAEEEKSIRFNRHYFKYKPSGFKTGISQLADELASLNGQLSYPTMCFINPKNEIIYQRQGFLSTPQLYMLLTQF